MFNLFRKKEDNLSQCYRRYFDDAEANMKLARSSLEKYKEIAPRVIAIIGDINVKDIDEGVITNLKKEMNAQGLSPVRRNHYLVTLKNVLGYLINQKKLKVLDPSKITKFRVPQKEVKYLVKEELIQLALAPNPNTITGSRNRAIIQSLISTGCRISELTAINRNQINFETGILSIRTKGDKSNQVIFNQSSLDAIRRYLEKRTDSCEALFATTHTDNPKRLQINDIQRSLRNLGRKLGFSINVTPHSLRRSSATLMFKEGVPLGVIQKFLNHSSSQVTTRFYLGNLDFEDLRKNHERVMNFDFKENEKKEQMPKIDSIRIINQFPSEEEMSREFGRYKAGKEFLDEIEDVVKGEPGIDFDSIRELVPLSELELLLALMYLTETSLYKGRFGYFHKNRFQK